MEDLISRQAVIDACDQSINLFEAVDRIKELAPVNPQPKTGHWIPVSERLPKWGEEVLTIDNDENYEINHIMDDERNEWFYDNDIVAWMPLPEPYKAESEDKR